MKDRRIGYYDKAEECEKCGQESRGLARVHDRTICLGCWKLWRVYRVKVEREALVSWLGAK